MVPIRGEWTPFADRNDQIIHYRRWGLISEKSSALRPVMVVDGYWGAPQPCEVVGYQGDSWAVIRIPDGFHAIHGDYLAEMQPTACQRLPRGVCFAEILSDYVVVDFLATENRFEAPAIEIAAIRYKYGTRIDQFYTLVNPGMPLPSDIVNQTGITQEDVDCAPFFQDVKSGLLSFVWTSPLIMHNTVRSYLLPDELTNPLIDTLPMARQAFSILPFHNLDYLNEALGLGCKRTNRAIDSAEAVNSLLWACLAPRKYERNVYQTYLDYKLSGAKNAKKSQEKNIDIFSASHIQIEFDFIVPAKTFVSQKLSAERLLDYVVFDIETTGFNRQKDQIIEIAAIRYNNGEPIDQFHTFVNPGILLPADIKKLTGITQEDVDGAPFIQDVESDFLNFIGNLPLVGHNIVSFDVPFLSAHFSKDIANHLFDTLIFARQMFPLLPSHKLEDLNQTLGLGSKGAHRALNDVEATNNLLQACLNPEKYESAAKAALPSNKPSDAQDSSLSPKKVPGGKRQYGNGFAMKHSKIDIKSFIPTDIETAKCGPLFEKNIVFTGELSISRSDAMQMAVDAGASLKTSVSKKTNYLVVGTQDSALVKGDGISGKEAKAYELNRLGTAKIEILNEDEFLALVRKDGAPV